MSFLVSLVKRLFTNVRTEGNDDGETRVIVVLNTDKVRMVKGASSLQDLTRISLRRGRHGGDSGDGDGSMDFEWVDDEGDDSEENEHDQDDELQELGTIGLRMAKLSHNASVVGHVDSTLLSLVMQVLLKHAHIGSLVMLRKNGGGGGGGGGGFGTASSSEIIGSTDPSRTMLRLRSESKALSASNTITTQDGSRILLIGEDNEHREDEPVFRNRPSRAERSFLEERF